MPGDAPTLAVRVCVDGAPGQRPRLDVAFETTETITAIMGPSGAGKTTLLESVAGILRPRAGRIALGGVTLFDTEQGIWVPPHRRRVALVLQSLALFPHLSAWENVAFGLRARTTRARKDEAMAWLSRAHAAQLADRLPATLSGGEAQRVALARALASDPRLILLDEPFSALNAELRAELGTVLRELLHSARVPALLVTHDRDDAQRLATRVLSLDAGRLVGDTRA